MNINDNQLNKEIEALKDESSPSTLQARIIGSILEPKKSKHIMTKRILGFGLSTLVVGAIAFGAIMAPRIATAAAVQQVRDAFEAVRNYHMTTYHTVDGKRQRVSEAWVEDGHRTTYTVAENGEMTLLNDAMIEVQGTLSGKILELKPAQVARGWTVERDNREIVVTGQEIEIELVETDVYEVQLSAVPSEKFQIELDAPKKPQDIFVVKPDGQFKGTVIQLEIMPFVDAEMSIEALQKLLEDKELWSIETNQFVNGKIANRYKLKEAFMDFTVYVDPQTKLPILTRQVLTNEKGKTTTTEVEYDYAHSLPPTSIESEPGISAAAAPNIKK